MTPDEVNDAVLAFLDQFITRGAAPDILSLRERLVSDPEARQLLDEKLPTHDLSEREAFDAMRAFFAEEWERGERTSYPSGPPDLVLLESWTSWEPDGGTSDPAQWHDWLDAVERTKRE